VIIDDASYSGTQINDLLLVVFELKPEADGQTVHTYLIVPFMMARARALMEKTVRERNAKNRVLGGAQFVLHFESVVVIPALADCAHGTRLKVRDAEFYTRSAMYFDHMFPDRHSTAPAVLRAIGAYEDDWEKPYYQMDPASGAGGELVEGGAPTPDDEPYYVVAPRGNGVHAAAAFSPAIIPRAVKLSHVLLWPHARRASVGKIPAVAKFVLIGTEEASVEELEEGLKDIRAVTVVAARYPYVREDKDD
jgi:hypothetical protein